MKGIKGVSSWIIKTFSCLELREICQIVSISLKIKVSKPKCITYASIWWGITSLLKLCVYISL